MGLIDFILNLAGMLLWFSWQSRRADPLRITAAATLVSTLRAAEPRRLPRWPYLAGLISLLLLRALLYRQIGSPADWTPKLDLYVVLLSFRSSHLAPMLLYSLLSFAQVMLVFYFWIAFFVTVNHGVAEPDPILKLIRYQCGAFARWHWAVQVIFPLLAVALLWLALFPLLAWAEVVRPFRSFPQLLGQAGLVTAALATTLKAPLCAVLFVHLVSSYIYLGRSPVWAFVTGTSRRLVTPLRVVPLALRSVDFAPLVGVVVVLLVLQVVPEVLRARGWVRWPE
jgi:uncharacterized protein YggT (Ycf19 family)